MMMPPLWTVMGRSRLFSGGPIQELAVEHLRLPDGRELTDFYQIRMADFALVFATTHDGRVMVLRQYKHGPRRVCLTFPGGAVADGESPLDAARRELLEETGCVANRWTEYGPYVTNANQYCNTAHLFRADRCRRVSSPTSPDLERPELLMLQEHELLRPDVLPQIGLASHVALLAIATHPRLQRHEGSSVA